MPLAASQTSEAAMPAFSTEVCPICDAPFTLRALRSLARVLEGPM
jgi:hypothetical protein